MLSNIDEESADDARRILTLLCYARRPLTVLELIDAVAVELGDHPRLNPDGRLLNEDEIRRTCPGLIEVDVDRRGDGPTVRIAHFSVQEYLESERIRQHTAATFSVGKAEAHAEIACICLTYLLEPALSPDSPQEYPLALYAAQNWHEHYRGGGRAKYDIENQAIQLFQCNSDRFENWVSTWNVDHYKGERPYGTVPLPIYYASLLGLEEIVRLLLDKGADVNAQGGEYGNALQAAASNGHEGIVRLLLDEGADVNAQGGFYGNALQVAAYEGHEGIVRLLLNEGADVNAQGGVYGNALQAAASRGHEGIVRLLLDKGAVKAES